MKIQRVDGSLVYDALELSFNMYDKTSILEINNVDSLGSLNLKATASNVYTKAEINANAMIYDNALNTKADKSNCYTRAEIITFETQYTFNGSLTKIVDPATGKFRISLNPNIPIRSSFTTRIDIQTPSQYGGSIRIIPALNNGGASVGYYNYIDTRWASAGDAWVCGVNCDNDRGYTITTPVLNTCVDIGLNGNISIPYGLTTAGIATSIITASTLACLTMASDVVSFNATSNRKL